MRPCTPSMITYFRRSHITEFGRSITEFGHSVTEFGLGEQYLLAVRAAGIAISGIGHGILP